MIEFRIRKAAESRGIKNPAQLARAIAASEKREVEAADEVLAGRLWKENSLPYLATIDRVLGALPGCEINELLVYKRHKSLPAKKAVKKR